MDLFALRGVTFGTKQLRIDTGSLQGNELASFLKLFICLQSLEYTNTYPICRSFPRKLTEAIAHLKPHLQRLEICNHGLNDSGSPIDSLADFEDLKYISVDQATLFGSDEYWEDDDESVSDEDESVEESSELDTLLQFLPKSIETLEITWSTEDYDLSAEV